jgi:hypothetical protein
MLGSWPDWLLYFYARLPSECDRVFKLQLKGLQVASLKSELNSIFQGILFDFQSINTR